MMSGPEIMKASEVQVCNSGFYDPNRKPKKNALLDSRMGPANKTIICETCHGELKDCPGHYGYLHLCLPVFNVGYFNAILNILKCICKSCARILLSEKERVSYLKKMRNPKAEALQKTATAKAILKSCKPKTCSRCGYVNAVVKKAGTVMGIIHDRSKKFMDDTDQECKAALSGTRIQILNPVRVLGLFKRILDQDCELLYLSDRPEKLIITDILVPPIAIRPSSFVDGGRSLIRKIAASCFFGSDECLLCSNLNNTIPRLVQDAWESLQVQVAQYINSEVRGVPLSMQSSKPLRGFVQRLKGKQGRFRGNLCGKRVEYTARTVISPDPNLKITEVGIPILIAQILTYPELVSQHNIEKLRKCVVNGAYKYPGVCAIVHLVVLFNRQPSLHRMSIMCHRAKIMPWRTLRFNESVCNPYNADFDGDEMNMHVPQTEEARTEALMLMGVQNNLCTPKNGEILVASTQDFLTSSFLITRRDTFYDRASFALMCTCMGDAIESVDLPAPALIKPVELWTGKQLFSVLVRPRAQMRVYVNLTVTEKSYKQGKETLCPNEGFVYFRNSELLCGQVGKATLGGARWIGNHGFSIEIQDRIKMEKQENDALIQKYKNGQLQVQPGCDAAQTLESELTYLLNGICMGTTEQNKKVDEKVKLHWRNSPLIMSQCGSKGSPDNISQMIACVGQQSVGGRRASNGFIDRNLPHFPKNSTAPDAKGFVENSFYTGLTPTEFFFHTMAGREGLVDTAVTLFNDFFSIIKHQHCVLAYWPSFMLFTCLFDITARGMNNFWVFLETCISRYYTKRIEAGTEIGAIGAQSIGEPGTQMTLKTFHFAGVASMNVTLGVPRIKEIINGAKNISTPIITAKLQSDRDVRSARRVKGCIEKTVLGEIAESMKIVLESREAYILVKLDMIRCSQLNISAKNVQQSLLGHPKLKLSPPKAKLYPEKVRNSYNAPLMFISRSFLNIICDRIVVLLQYVKVVDDRSLKILSPEEDRTKLHFALHSLKSMLPEVVVMGVPTVERVIVSEKQKKGKGTGEYEVFVEGTNLLAVMGIPGVKGEETTSNRIIEVQQTLGIEAARRCIIEEIQHIMKEYKMSIDVRHMMLLADVMTSNGEVLGITRFGIQKMKESVLMLASFEKTQDHLFNGSLNGRVDMIEGVSECIIMGIPMQLGTGILKVRQRVEHIPQLDYGGEPILSCR
ncbi:hypothetical protein MKW98_004097 [Papaver atlanticum]|uniref:DNA-directed RNA polymerase subunit n=1 Tax=Papaver atlanticum TaxID=357466 RepID=A0AAD4T2A6_9MAGN|nr:hypothetical protein MKW98_004097 [Papaver atlanticum]